MTGMIPVAIVTRRLKEGKTCGDFRKAWFHTMGFGMPSRLCTMIHAADSRVITIMSFIETGPDRFEEGLRVDVKERLDHSSDDIIRTQIGRSFGIPVDEDDLSTQGQSHAARYRPLERRPTWRRYPVTCR